MPLRVQFGRSLRHMVVILFIRRHIDHFVRDARVLRIAPVHHAVRRLNKAVLVDARVAGKRIDQTDIRSFRRLDRAHPSVVRIVNVADLESGAVTGKTAGAQRGETALVRQLAERVVLVHKLGQLGGAEKLLDRRLHRLDIDQRLRRQILVRIMRRHALAHHSLRAGEADAVLILQKLSHRADAAVAQMVDIVVASDLILEMHIVVNGSENVLFGNMLGDQLVNTLAERIRQSLRILVVLIADQDLTQRGIVHLLVNPQLLRVAVHKMRDVHHQIGQHLDVSLLGARRTEWPHSESHRPSRA